MSWKRSSDNSLTESFVQQNNIHVKLDQVLTRFHKLDKAKFPSNGRLTRRFYNKTEYEIENIVTHVRKKTHICLFAYTNLLLIFNRFVQVTRKFQSEV